MDEPLVIDSLLYRECKSELEEVLRHKWLESEKAGCDVGFDWALFDWCIRHRRGWRAGRRRNACLS
jgi:hypothetical protein